ncbi:1,2-phenylacetyl-CoA epoxidase subunit PaaC [Flaviaesturariibacter amylovorans]|uniref:Phenylacetate-CoA oxygenase subunit PaaC n=1 Tax=Flaviaesturariibacter amylovorans TaxID=1084520 RepID=A0ABP8G968_9BACT
MNKELFEYTLHLADNALILGQRNAEWCGHGPALEQDIALTNISLDLIGQARLLYQYAADQYNAMDVGGQAAVAALLPKPWKEFNRALQEDDLAYLREERQFRNLLITELPKGDWAMTILRQFFFSAFQYLQYQQLQQSSDATLAAIADKSLKETAYHLRWSGEWVIRLGDGTAESRRRIEAALADLWMFTGEAFVPAAFETGIAPDPAALRSAWDERIGSVFAEATLDVPATGTWSQGGGKRGVHTEHLGYLLAEMQVLQRTYPNMTW